MDRTWLVDSRGIAKIVKNVNLPSEYQIKDCGACRECPNCHYHTDNNDGSYEWLGLPAGVKFDPTDSELVAHLAAKCGLGNWLEPHMFLDEFIPTLEGDDGICYTHPENLPRAKKDGNIIHFFDRTRNAYATGQRKHSKIYSEGSSKTEQVRWHKTGKTKHVMENGVQKGFKKIMVLYRTSVKGSKPDKSDWVMHQYHLGTDEDEKQGEFVVSKIFYQPQKQKEKKETPVKLMNRSSPKTLATNDPIPPRQVVDHDLYPSCLSGEPQVVDENGINDALLYKEISESFTLLDDSNGSMAAYFQTTNEGPSADRNGEGFGFSELENLRIRYSS